MNIAHLIFILFIVVGQNITINYNPSNPNLYYITGTFSDLILSILFIIFPTILLFIVK